MVQFVRVTYGDSPIIAAQRSFDTMCIIGDLTGTTSVLIGPLMGANDLLSYSNENPTVLATTDKLYIAAVDFFSINPSGKLYLGGIGSTGTVYEDAEFLNLGVDEDLNYVYMAPYSPLDSGGLNGGLTKINIEIYALAANFDADPVPPAADGWVNVDVTDSDTTGCVVELLNTEPTGKITFNSGSFAIKTTDDGGTTVYGYTFAGTERVRCTIDASAIGDVFKLLTEPGVQFEMFAFAYDPSLDCPTIITAATDKYYSTNTIGGSSWLHDLQMGAKMATQFVSAGQYCMFCGGLPENTLPNEAWDDSYATDTSFATTNTVKYESIITAVGGNKFVALFVSDQAADASSHDPAIAGMGSLSKKKKRPPLTFYPTEIRQTDYPDNTSAKQWADAQVNAVVYIDRVVPPVVVWGSNKTLGQSNDGDINFIRCKNIMAYNIETALYNVLLSQKAKYDAAGIARIKSSIIAVLQAAVGTLIDGVGEVAIPIEYYVNNESSLTTGEAAILAAARTSKAVNDISISYLWSGDIETISVSYLGLAS